MNYERGVRYYYSYWSVYCRVTYPPNPDNWLKVGIEDTMIDDGAVVCLVCPFGTFTK